jgi:protein TonB
VKREFLNFALALVLGGLTAFGLFWLMQVLVSVSGELKEGGGSISVEFVRLKRDSTPPIKKREKPKREKPQQQPPPPQMDMAKNMRPGDAVGAIVPDVDTSMELEKATNLTAGGASDRDPVPLVRVDPEYPPRARQQGIEGYVDVEFTITPLGTIADATVIDSRPPYVFDRAALRAVRKYRYNPQIEEGVATSRPGVQLRLRFTMPKGRR